MIDGEAVDIRLARVEQRVADMDDRGSRGLGAVVNRVTRNEQRLADLDTRVAAMMPLAASVVTLTERIAMVRDDQAEMKHSLSRIEEDRKAEKAEERRERTLGRRWMAGLTVTILCALLTASVVLLTSGIH